LISAHLIGATVHFPIFSFRPVVAPNCSRISNSAVTSSLIGLMKITASSA